MVIILKLCLVLLMMMMILRLEVCGEVGCGNCIIVFFVSDKLFQTFTAEITAASCFSIVTIRRIVAQLMLISG